MEAPPTTVDTAPVTGGVAPTRGRGGQMRGSYERGRGRGMGRGHYGGLGGPGGYPGRGGFVPRGAMGGPPMGYPGRGGFLPRGAPPVRGGPGIGGPGGYQGRGGGIPRGGPPMRGTSRMPLYSQPPKQHTGVDNNKTVSPVQATVTNQVVSGEEETDANAAPATPTDPNGTTPVVATAAPIAAKPLSTGISPNYRGTGRGRGIGGIRGGRGAYNPHNGTVGMGSMYGGPQLGEHGVIRRGGPPRGRGQYATTGMTRPPLMQQQPHIANTQVTLQTSLKRGAPGGPPGPKRGRYEGGPYSQRVPTPKYHQSHMAPPATYAMQHQTAQQPAPQSHHSYVQHDPSQTMDPYGQSYAAPQAQTSYNGYGQTAAYSHATPTHTTHQANSGYSTHAATEYDQSQYQGYSSTYAQQDTRYQTYGQDYTQQYGAPAVDYSTSQADYTQHAQQSYDERAYASYDTQSYQQSYANSTGYY